MCCVCEERDTHTKPLPFPAPVIISRSLTIIIIIRSADQMQTHTQTVREGERLTARPGDDWRKRMMMEMMMTMQPFLSPGL